MQIGDEKFAGSIPEFYEEWLVPLIFEDYASDMARRVVAQSPQRILETASGSGVVARSLIPLLTASCDYVATDLNGDMLAHAAKLVDDDGRVSWQQANAMDLPFDDQSFDMVVCQFGIMFFPDRLQGYRESRRVLGSGGKFVFNVWDSLEGNDFANMVEQAVTRLLPENSPRFLSRTPYAYFDHDLIRRELSEAGFTDIQIDTDSRNSPARDARHPATAYCFGTPLRAEIENHPQGNLAKAREYAASEIEKRFGDGPVEAKMTAHIVTASVP